jgi:hypothetical protein
MNINTSENLWQFIAPHIAPHGGAQYWPVRRIKTELPISKIV